VRERARCVAAALAQWSRAAAELGLRAAWAEAEQRRAHCAEQERLAARRSLAQLEKQAERDRSLAQSRLQEREATSRQLLTLQALP